MFAPINTTETTETLEILEITINKKEILTVCLLAIIIYAVFYFLMSFALYKMSKKAEMKNNILAFIPVARLYRLGKLAGPVRLNGKVHYKMAIPYCIISGINGLISVLSSVFMFGLPFIYILGGKEVFFTLANSLIIPEEFTNVTLYNISVYMQYFSEIFSIATFVFELFIFGALYRRYTPRNYVLFMVLSLLGLTPIMLMIVRNNTAVDYNTYVKQKYDEFMKYKRQQMNNTTNNNYDNSNDNYSSDADPFANDGYSNNEPVEDPFESNSNSDAENNAQEDPFENITDNSNDNDLF